MLTQSIAQLREAWQAHDNAGREQVYVQGSGKGDFWERASLVWGDVGWEPGGGGDPERG